MWRELKHGVLVPLTTYYLSRPFPQLKKERERERENLDSQGYLDDRVNVLFENTLKQNLSIQLGTHPACHPLCQSLTPPHLPFSPWDHLLISLDPTHSSCPHCHSLNRGHFRPLPDDCNGFQMVSPSPVLLLPFSFIVNPDQAFQNVNLTCHPPFSHLKNLSGLLRKLRLLSPRPKIFTHLASTYFSQRSHSNQMELPTAYHLCNVVVRFWPSHRLSPLSEKIISFHPQSSVWITLNPPVDLKSSSTHTPFQHD